MGLRRDRVSPVTFRIARFCYPPVMQTGVTMKKSETMGDKVTNLDEIARRMAADQEVSWDALNDYPGYGKNRWREEAERMVCAEMPQAVIIPGRMCWDGSMSETFVLGYTR